MLRERAPAPISIQIDECLVIKLVMSHGRSTNAGTPLPVMLREQRVELSHQLVFSPLVIVFTHPLVMSRRLAFVLREQQLVFRQNLLCQS
jgi:hypothetical protein